MRDGVRRGLVSGTVGALCLATALIAAAIGSTPLARVQQAVLPTGGTPFMWSWPAPWPLLVPLVGALAAAAVHAAILRVVPAASAGRAVVARTWLAAVAAGAVVGMTVDAVLVFGTLFTHGWALWAVDLGSRAASGAYWGLLYGWIPALVAHRLARHTATPVAGLPVAPESGAVAPGRGPSTTGGALIAVGVAVVSLILLGSVHLAGNEAAQAQVRADAEETQPAPADGSLRPDPEAPGDAVPERVDGGGITGTDACTPDRAMMLIHDVDGATGHRALPLELMNFSEAPCVIEGYPDIAFGDQNGHLLAVTVEHGGSFMGSDPGPSRITIPPGRSARAIIGWDAASTHGVLVARTIWGATLAGETRGSKPVDADIVEGGTVAVTAWHLADPASPEE